MFDPNLHYQTPRYRMLMQDPQSQQHAIDIAVMRAEMAHRDEQLDKLTAAVKTLSDKVDTISATLTEAKGGWRMLMMVGGASGVLGAIAAQLYSSVRGS